MCNIMVMHYKKPVLICFYQNKKEGKCESTMKKQRNLISVLCVICMLVVNFVPVTKVYAETLADQATTTVAFGEFDQIDLKSEEVTTLKIVLKETGTFILDFSPKSVDGLQAELYDEENNLLGSGGYWYSPSSYVSPSFVGYKKDLAVGTYYLRLYAHTAGTYTYFARQIPTDTASINMCISLKIGNSVQLGTIFNNSKDKDVKWSSSKKNIATVSSKGKVKAIKKGTTVIKVYNSSGLVSKITIKVVS